MLSVYYDNGMPVYLASNRYAINTALQRHPDVRELTLLSPLAAAARPVPETLVQLTRLTKLVMINISITDEEMRDLARFLVNLEVLELRGCFFSGQYLFGLSETLSELHLIKCRFLKKKYVFKALNYFKQRNMALRKLTVCMSDDNQSSSLGEIPLLCFALSKFPSLISLHADNLEQEYAELSSVNATQLQTLKLKKISGDVFESERWNEVFFPVLFIRNLPALTTLEIGEFDGERLPLYLFMDICVNCPNLRSLTLTYRGHSDLIVEHLMSLEQLKHLNLNAREFGAGSLVQLLAEHPSLIRLKLVIERDGQATMWSNQVGEVALQNLVEALSRSARRVRELSVPISEGVCRRYRADLAQLGLILQYHE